MRQCTLIYLIAICFSLCLIITTVQADEIPPGFETIPEETSSVVDVYLGKKMLIQTLAEIDNDELKFINPEEIIKQLQRIKNRQALLQALSQTLPANEQLACPVAKPTPGCGYIKTNDVAVIYNTLTYRVDLIINPKYFLPGERAKLTYKDDPSSRQPSYLNHINMDYADQGTTVNLSLNNNGVAGAGRTSLISNWAANYRYEKATDATASRYTATQFYANYLLKKLNYQAGLLTTDGNDILPSLPIFGTKLSTTKALTNNSNLVNATPISITVATPSYVNVFQGVKLIGTSYFLPGLHYLNTSGFPTGAYLITIKIRDIYNNEQKQVRFFVKTAAVPILGHPDYYAAVGKLRNTLVVQNWHTLFGDTNIWVGNLGAFQRISDLWALRYSVLTLQDDAISSIGIVRLFNLGTLSANSLYTTRGSEGFTVDANFLFWQTLPISLLYRYLDIDDREADLLEGGENYESSTDLSFTYQLTPRLSSGYSLALVHARHDRHIRYSTGLSLRWQAFKTGSTVFRVGLSSRFSNSETLLNLSLSVTFTTEYWNINAGHNHIQGLPFDGTSNDSHIENNSVGLGWASPEYAMNGQYNLSSNSRSWTVGGSMNNPHYSTKANFSETTQDQHTTLQGSAALQTSLIYNRHGLHFTKQTDNHGVTVHITSKDERKFFVLANGRTLGSLSANTSKFFTLPKYKTQSINIAATDGSPSEVKSDNNQAIILYEGNIQAVDFHVTPAFNLITTFVYPNGDPVGKMDIEGASEYSQTDNMGMATLITRDGQVLTLVNGKTSCQAKVENVEPEDGIAFVDKIICHPSKEENNI